MCLHLDRMIEVFGEPLGCLMFRKIAPWYGKRFGPVSEFNRHVVRISTRAEFHDVLERYRRWRAQFCDADGELLERFRPGPMVASFLLPQTNTDPSATRREAIPVPKGPVDNW